MKKTKILLYLNILIFYIFSLHEITVAKTRKESNISSLLTQNETIDINSAFNIALKYNPTIDIFISKIEQVKQRILQIKASRWPCINIESSFKVIDDSIEEENINFYNLKLKTSWILFDGFKKKFEELIENHNEEIAIASLFEARRLLLLAVTDAFYNAQLFNEKVNITKIDELFNKSKLKEAEKKYNLGLGSLNDVLNFKIKLNNSKITRINEEKKYNLAISNLISLLGIQEINSTIKLEPLSAIIKEELFPPNEKKINNNEKIRQRPDLLIRNLITEQAKIKVSSTNASKYPKCFIHASIETKEIEKLKLFDDLSKEFYIGMSYTFFNGGKNIAKSKESKAYVKETEKIFDKYLINAKKEIEHTILKIHNLQKKIILQQKNIILMEKRKKISEKKYEVSSNSLMELNESQNDLIKAHYKLATTTVLLKQTWTKLTLLTETSFF